jgi:hypothetical protein
MKVPAHYPVAENIGAIKSGEAFLRKHVYHVIAGKAEIKDILNEKRQYNTYNQITKYNSSCDSLHKAGL